MKEIFASNVEIVKNQNETNASLIRRFQKRVQESGVIKRARSTRFFERPKSKYERQQRSLKRIERQKRYERLKKLGKI